MNHRSDLIMNELRVQARSFCPFANGCDKIGKRECSDCLKYYQDQEKLASFIEGDS